MDERRSPELSSKLTLTATLAALYAFGRIIPVSKLIGISGFITAGGIIAPLIGIMLEPSYGMAAVIIGTIVGSLVPWNPLKYYGFDFLPGALNVVMVSFAVRSKRARSIIMFIFMLGLFLVSPNTAGVFVGKFYSPPVPYLWLHLVALIVLISPLSSRLGARLSSTNRASLLLAVTVLAFTGTMIEHVTGGVLFALVLGRAALPLWPLAFLAYPTERVILVAGAVLVCTPTVILVRSVIRERIIPR